MKKGNGVLKTIILVLMAILTIGAIGYVGYGVYKKLTRNIPNPLATIKVANFGTIKVELYPEEAPDTVANFIRLANRGYYNGKTFHRTVPDFMIQGGSKNGDGTGNATLDDLRDGGGTDEYTIKGEFIANDVENGINLRKGVIAMARQNFSDTASMAEDYNEYLTIMRNGYNSGSAQFFIMNADNTDISGLYAGFGKVVEGLDIVDKIANVEVVTREENAEGADKPVDPPVITSISVETYGIDYGEPQTFTPFDINAWINEKYGALLQNNQSASSSIDLSGSEGTSEEGTTTEQTPTTPAE